MIRTRLLVFTAVTIFAMLADRAEAQIAFSVTQQNGVVTGGGFQVGGVVTNGGMGVRLGISASTSQLIGLQTFTFQNGINNRPPGPTNANPPAPRLSAGRFIKASKRFDVDKDGRLDRKELNNMAMAVVAELRQRLQIKEQPGTVPAGETENPNGPPSAEKMVESFVTRCMTYDRNDDDALDATETKRMATAFIRSLN